jgi:hypothetical protein
VKFSQNLISNNYKKMKKTMKRVSSNDASCIEEYPRKKRAVVVKGESKRFKAVSTAPLLEKVDAIAYPQNNMGEKYMHYSYTNCTNQLYEMRRPCNVTTHFPETIEEPDYSCSNLSSVASCSVISGSEFFGDTLAGACQDEEDTLCSGGAEYLDVEDVDGFYDDRLAHPCHSDENTICSDAESLDVEDVDEGCRIHRLELNAYLCTLEAMYASGPLSWEKEELLTNLRISLNISNDEHLTGIKNLVSSGQNF